MKKALHFILLVAAAVSMASCDGFLDPEYPSQVSLDEFWSSPEQARLGVAAIYDDAQGAFEQNYWRWGELRADNFIKNDRPPSNVQQVIDNGLTPSTAGADWSDLYAAIAGANVAIDKIPDVSSFDDQDNLLAQALTLRALFYFYAVRVWGQVPNVTEPITELNPREGRAKVSTAEIFDGIILPDLQRAEELMSADQGDQGAPNEISLGPVLALKAHVYMWPGSHQDYAVGRDAIVRLEDLGYSLETTASGWTGMFREAVSSSELVFALGWNFSEDGGNSGVGTFVSATPSYVPSEDLEQKWRAAHPDDYRILETATFDVEIVNQNEFPFYRILSKYSGSFQGIGRDQQGNWGRTNEKDIIFYRLSGLLLLKAEAENYLNNPAEAITSLNRVRSARGLDPVDKGITDQETIRDLILDERQFELMGEGHRYWDLVRNGVVIDVMNPINGMNSEGKIVWPISQNVLNRNENIVQNEGYR